MLGTTSQHHVHGGTATALTLRLSSALARCLWCRRMVPRNRSSVCQARRSWSTCSTMIAAGGRGTGSWRMIPPGCVQGAPGTPARGVGAGKAHPWGGDGVCREWEDVQAKPGNDAGSREEEATGDLALIAITDGYARNHRADSRTRDAGAGYAADHWHQQARRTRTL